MPTLEDAVAGVLGAQPDAPETHLPTPTDPVAAAVDQVLGGQRTQVRSTLMEAAQTPPDTAAKAVHAAREADVDFATALRNLSTLENRLTLERADKRLGEAPNVLLRYFTQSDFAAMAQDDLDNLLGVTAQVREHGALRAWSGPKPTAGSVASGLAQSLPQGFRAARAGLSLQMADALQALGVIELDPVEQREMLRRAEQAAGASAYTTPDIQDPTLRAIYGGAASTLRAAPGIALSLAARSSVPALAAAGVQTQAEAYPKYRARGAGAGLAAMAALGEGAVEVGTELLPMGFLVDKFGKAGAREFIGGILARDVPTEQVATILQDAIDTAVANPDKTWGEYLQERPGAAYQTLVSTLTQSAIIGGASVAAERLARESNRQADAEQDAQALDKLFTLAAQSKLRERDPQTFERFLQDVADDADGAPSSVWIDGQVLLQSLPPEQLAEVLPEVAQQAVEAAAIGGAVEIPVGAFAARLAGTGVEKTLLQHLRVEPDGLSQAEAKEAADAAAEAVKQEAERLLAETEDQDAARASAETVKATVLQQLGGAKRFKPEVNDAYASLVRDFYAATAARLGTSAEDLYARYPLRVAGAAPAGGVLSDEGAQRSPEARRFGVDFQPLAAVAAPPVNPFDANRVMAPAEAKELAKTLGVKVDLGDAAALSGADFFKALEKAAGGQAQALEALRAAGYDAIVSKPKNGEQKVGALEQRRGKGPAVEPTTGLPTPETAKLVEGGEARYRLNFNEAKRLRAAAAGMSIPHVADRYNRMADDHIATAREYLGDDTLRQSARLPGSPVLNTPRAPTVDEMAQHSRVEDVPLGRAFSTQAARQWDRFESGDHPPPMVEGYADKPVAVRLRSGEFLILDGHHRTERALAAGERAMPMHVIDAANYDPANAGRKPAEGGPSDDDLMAELLEQAQPARPPRGTFSPSTLTISLLENADLSTFLHETGHFFLEVLADLASQPDAPAKVQEDMGRALEWFGVKGDKKAGVTPLAAWNAMTLDEKRPHHERFAESFEQYLLEGKAPSAELRPLFARFRSWLISVYKSLSDFTGRYQTKLSDEVRGVFDRLIATEAQIAEAQRLAGYEAVFKSAAEAGMTPEQWAAYQAKGEAATTAAVEELQKRSLRNLRWTVNARSRALKRLQAEAEDKRRAMRERVAAEVDEMPIMRARAFLDKATEATPEERDAAKDWRDRRAAAQERFTEEVKAALMASPEAQGLKGLAKGQFIAKNRRSVANQVEAHLIAWERENPKPRREHPPVELQAVAELFGFESGEALGRALVEEWSREETIDGLTEQRLLEAYGDMATPEGITRAADEAIHNEARARFVAAEMAAMQTATSTTTDTGKTARNGRPIRTSLVLQVARNTAELLVTRRKIVDLKPGAFTGAETRAAKRGAQMQAAGNTAEAIAAKRDELFNHYAARYTMDAQAEVEKKLDYLRKFDKESVRKALPPEYLDQIDKLLERFDLRRSTTARDIDKRASLLAWVKEQEDLGLQPVVPDALLDEARSTSYKSLTVEEFRGLVDAVKNVEHLGRLKGKLLKAKDAREFAAIVDEIATSIRDNAVVEREARDNAPTAKDRAVDTARDFFSMHRKLASIIRQLDGFKDAGPLWQVFGRTMNESADAEAVMREQATKKLAPIFERLLKTGNLRDTVTPPGVSKALSLETRLAVALNWGNEANRQRVMDGDRWSQQQVESILGTLTTEQLGIVQELWDQIDSYWPEIKAKEERVSGVAPEKVQAAPFTVNLTGGAKVEMRGGYYPIKYDPDKSAKAEADSAAEITRQMLQGQYTRATTRRGHTKARAETVNRTVRKDLGVIFEHVTQVAHDLTWHEWLIDANRLLRAGGIDAAIRETMGPETVREMRKALEDIAAGDVPAQSGFERAMNHLRTGVTVVGMGWNLMTSLMQPLGLTQSAVRIGPKWVAKGLARWIGDAARMENTAREVYAASDFMRLRGETMNREINEIRNKVQGKRFTAVEQSYFWLIQKAQLVADMPTWLGQYEKAMAEEADEARAVALADQAVRDAQGSGEIASLARIQRGGPLQKLFTNFYSYFSTTFNLTAERYRQTQLTDPLQAGRFAVDMLMLYTVPAVLGEAVRAAFTGGDDDDDGLAEKLVRAQANYLLGTMVGLRELGAAVNGFTGYQGPAGTRFFSEVAKLGKQVEQGEVDAAALKAANNTAGILFHYPAGQVNRTVEGFLAIQEGRTANPAALVFGPPRE